MQTQSNPVNWFEIAVTDMARAKKFYGAVFDVEFQDLEMDGSVMAMFPWDTTKPGSSGSLYQHKEAQPNTQGTTVYISCEDCANEASNVERNGGQLIVPKTSIGEFGVIAQFIDTEGNRVGMHSQN
jgi:hypothetical protein